MKQAVSLSLALLLASNGMAWLIHTRGLDRQLVYVPWMLVLLGIVLWWAHRSAGLSWAEIGLSGAWWKQSALTGAAIGTAPVILLVLFFRAPFLLTGPVRYREIQELDASRLLWRLGVEVPLATALAEELLFRGILQALFRRSLDPAGALLWTNVVFALWHIVINATSVQQNALALPFVPAAAAQIISYLGSLFAVGLGGIVLSVLRERTRHLAGSIALHYVAVAALTLLVYLQR